MDEEELIQFKIGKCYKVHGSEEGMLVIRRGDKNLLVNIDGEELTKTIGIFVNSEFVWTDNWHVAIARKENKETD